MRLAHETGGSRLDRYGRTLAYLYLEPGGLFVNREIIARGFGHAYTKYPFRYAEDFRQAEHEAREKGLGLWGPDPLPATAETVVYVVRTGTKYHRRECKALARSTNPTEIPLGEAVRRYTPCAQCDPPRLP